ncbi:MAG: lysine 2,3-aminomutase [Leptospiraceae bacterium]|nr:MAG: lysine 2,3-aminomutase [Leptospiraceae bacterium]
MNSSLSNIYFDTNKYWKKELQNSIKTLEELIDFLGKERIKKSPYSYILEESYKKNFQKIHQNFRFQVTKYYISLANLYNQNCPILLQILPNIKEIEDPVFKEKDPLREEIHSPIPELVHRYPDRVLWYLSHNCAVYCRFCMRKRKVSHPSTISIKQNLFSIIEYIKNNKNIKEVILSGGDPLSLEDKFIEEILFHLKRIEHLYSIRIHTRMPVTLPYRITEELCNILEKYYPVTVVTHFNHPIELTDIVYEKIKFLKKSGVLVLNQSVLLKNINDNASILEELFLKLIKFGIKPYYLHHCDEVYGTSHFRVSLQKGIEIIRQLQGRNPGIALPKYVVDLPDGGGKIPIVPNILKNMIHQIRNIYVIIMLIIKYIN